jgi:hypothetical protein
MVANSTMRSGESANLRRCMAERVRCKRGLEAASRISVVMTVLNLAAASVLISGGFKQKGSL